MPPYVLDTSAILCVLLEEDGTDRVVGIIQSARAELQADLLVPFIALMEVEYHLLRLRSPREAEAVLMMVESWPIRVLESTPQWRHEAARIKATVRLSVADAWVAALAMLHQGTLVHKDPEFERVDGLRVLRLPYKGGAT
jgi:predicted nucleic acid-binding protein